MRPLVSVIVPVYRVEEYLPACVDSILAQTYDNLEILLIDDGSPDGCGALCDAYAKSDGRVRVLHQPNGGLSAARNAGLALARGETISFIDGDDTVSPVFIEALLGAGADIAQCGFCTDARLLGQSVPDFQLRTGREASLELQSDATGAFTVAWNKLYRRTLFDGLRFPAGRLHEDEFVTYRALWRAERCAIANEPLYHYRRRPDSIMGAGFSPKSLDALAALEERAAFYRGQGEPKLSALTQAVYCHRLRGLMGGIRRVLPDETAGWRKKLRESYRAVLRAPDVGQKKKASLTLRMLSPALYDRLKKGSIP